VMKPARDDAGGERPAIRNRSEVAGEKDGIVAAARAEMRSHLASLPAALGPEVAVCAFAGSASSKRLIGR
jgi:hypothetical protein